jgi:hypothetical protein
VYAGSVWKPGIEGWFFMINSSAHTLSNIVNGGLERVFVRKLGIYLLKFAFSFDVNLFGAIDQNFGYGFVAQIIKDRP